MHLAKVPHGIGIDIDGIVKSSAGFSGAGVLPPCQVLAILLFARRIDFASATMYVAMYVERHSADVVQLCREASLAALHASLDEPSIEDAHFTDAFKRVGSSLSRDLMQFYDSYRSGR